MLLVRRGDGLPGAGEAFSGAGDGFPGTAVSGAAVVAETREAILPVTRVLGGSSAPERLRRSKQ